MKKIYNFPERHPFLAMILSVIVSIFSIILWISFKDKYYQIFWILIVTNITTIIFTVNILEGRLKTNLPSLNGVWMWLYFTKREYDYEKICLQYAKVSFVLILMYGVAMMLLVIPLVIR